MIPLEDLSFPKALNLDILLQNIPDAEVRSIIVEYMQANLEARRITLPSTRCWKKVLCHYYYSKVENGTATWDEIKGSIKLISQTLELVGMTKKQVMKQYLQREKEILKEKK